MNIPDINLFIELSRAVVFKDLYGYLGELNDDRLDRLDEILEKISADIDTERTRRNSKVDKD